jgi:hypothetical protein
MANLWDPLPREAKGDEGFDKIYHAVGLSLSAWETLESGLAALFKTLIPIQFDAPLIAAFGSVASGPARIQMIVAAANALFALDAGTFKDLKTLMNEIGNMSGRRNEIAHGTVSRFTGPDDTDHGCYLVPAWFNTKKKRSPRKPFTADSTSMDHYTYAYTSAQILEYAERFKAYSEKVWPLIERVDKAQKAFALRLKQLGQHE